MMKSVLFVVLLGFAAARVVSDQNNVVDSIDTAFQKSFEGAGRLFAAVYLPGHIDELHAIERDMKTKLGEFLKEALDDLVNNVKEKINKVKGVTTVIGDKVQELRQKLRELGEGVETKSKESIELVKKKVHEIVEALRDSLKHHEKNLDQELDEAAKLKVKDLINKIRERISNKVKAIRQYIKDITIDNEVVTELQNVLDKLDDSELTEILKNVTDLRGHEMRHLRELYQKLKDLTGKTEGVLNDKLNDLLGYVQSLWKNGIQELVEKFQKVRSTLIEVIGNTKDLSVEAVKDALKHIEAYKEELGDLYGRLIDTLKKAIGKF